MDEREINYTKKKFEKVKKEILRYLRENAKELELTQKEIEDCDFQVVKDSDNNNSIGVSPNIYKAIGDEKMKEFNYLLRE